MADLILLAALVAAAEAVLDLRATLTVVRRYEDGPEAVRRHTAWVA